MNCSLLSFVPAGARMRGSEGLYKAYKVMLGEACLGIVSGSSKEKVRAAGVALVVAETWKVIGASVFEAALKTAAENARFVAGREGREFKEAA